MTPLFTIVDGHSLAYRTYHGTRKNPLTSESGEPTEAVYAFTRHILNIMLKQKPDYFAVSFDAGLSGRDEIFDAYKAGRPDKPEDFEQQLGRMREVLDALNVPMLVVDGYEADDVIGTAVRQVEAMGVDSRIVTGDGDLLQLITEHVDVDLQRPFGGPKLYGLADFREKYDNLDPPQLVDIKSLEGDSSDNIPGIKGVGEKTARPLLKKYGSLQGIYDHLDEINGRNRKKLEGGRTDAFMSYELARIQCDIPLNIVLEQCTTTDYDLDKVLALFDELNFRSLAEELRKVEEEPAELVQQGMFDDEVDVQAGEFGNEMDFAAPGSAAELIETYAVRDASGLEKLVRILNDAEMIAFDTETTGVDPVEADLVGISLAVSEDIGYYIPVGHMDEKAPQLSIETVMDALHGPLTNPDIPKVAHNAAYDLVILRRYGIDVSPIGFDTMIAEWVRNSASTDLSLSNLALVPGLLTQKGVLMQDIKDLIGSGKKQITMAAVPVSKAAPYAAEDAGITFRLVAPLQKKLAEYDAAVKLLENLEMPLIPVLASMQQHGVLLDVDFLQGLSARLEDQLAEIERAIYDNSGGYGEFNVNSPKQLNDVLFGKLNLPRQGLRKTTHGYSTAADVLEKLLQDTGHPILEKIMEHRELSKLKGTYVDALPDLINPVTGRLHTSFNQTGTTTGRVSSSNPNLQNIPTRTEIGREVRRAFITPDGTQLLSVDYSQVELRIMAHIADDPTLKQAFRDGQDIHSTTAALVYDVPLDEVSYEQRAFAKRINFGLLYGMGAFRLARDSNLTLAEADRFIETYFERLPNVEKYIEDTKAHLHQENYVETLFGRRRYFGDVSGMSHNLRNRAEREAINMPIQGTAADIIKRAMIELQKALEDRQSNTKLLLQVHDELLLEVPESELEETAALVVDIMENAYVMDPMLKANAQAGDNWRDLMSIL